MHISFADFLPILSKYLNEHNQIVKLLIGPDPVIFVAEYKFLEFLLTTNRILDKSKVYKYFKNWIGTGLLTAGGKYQQKISMSDLHQESKEKVLQPKYYLATGQGRPHYYCLLYVFIFNHYEFNLI